MHLETIEEIADNIISTMKMISPRGAEDIKYILGLSRGEMRQFHHTIGRQIRNEYGLWKPDNSLTKIWHDLRANGSKEGIIDGVDHHPLHPDSISTEILFCVWDKIHKQNYEDFYKGMNKT